MNNDTISRSAVIEALEMRKSSFESMLSSVSDMIINAIVMCKTVVETAPAIDAAPVVHARWIRPASAEDRIDAPRCSNCGEETIQAAGWFGNYKFTPYCPYCGDEWMVKRND